MTLTGLQSLTISGKCCLKLSDFSRGNNRLISDNLTQNCSASVN